MIDKNKKTRYSMTDEELKSLKKSIEYVKSLDIFDENKDKENNKVKRVA